MEVGRDRGVEGERGTEREEKRERWKQKIKRRRVTGKRNLYRKT